MVLVEMMHQLPHLTQWKALGVQGENTTPVHIVDICPHGLQRDMSMAIVVNGLGDFVDILVSISAIVELNRRVSIK
jgi:hypothetical protein